MDELSLQDHTYHTTKEEGERKRQNGTIDRGTDGTTQEGRNSHHPDLGAAIQKKEPELQLQILVHRLAIQDPKRSSNKASSSKRGNRGGALTNGKAGHLGSRTTGDSGTTRRPNLISKELGHV